MSNADGCERAAVRHRSAGLVALAMLWAAAGAGLIAGLPVQAQGFPSRQVTIVVPYPPGGATDLVTRVMQPRLQALLGQSVVIENKGGANGSVGAASVAKSAPDGYRILMATQPIVTINPYLQKDSGFDPLKDLVPLTNAVDAVVAVAVSASLPVSSLTELMAYGRKNPGKLSFGTAGAGSPQHLGGLQLGQRAQIEWTHVPYKGGGPLINDLLAGHVPVAIASMSVFKPFLKDNRLRILAVGEKTRYAGTPDIPTVAESLPGFELNTWLGFYAPAGTPPEVTKVLVTAITSALQSDEVRARLQDAALVVNANGPEALARTARSDFESYGRLIRENTVTLD